MRKYLKTVLALTLAMAISASAMAFDEMGASISEGWQTSNSVIGCSDPDNNIYWSRMGIFGRNYFNNNKWYTDSELEFGQLKWIKTDNFTKCCHDKGYPAYSQTLSLEGRMMLMRKLDNFISFGAGGGLALLSDKDQTHHLTKSTVQYLLSAKVRFSFFIGREYGVDIQADHISGFGEDEGVNVWTVKLYLVL